MLKFMVDTLDSVPEAVRSLYTEREGKFVLGVEGAVPKERLDEFRSNNVTLKKQLEAFEGVDVEKYRSLTEQEAKIREKKLIDAGKVDELLAERVGSMKSEYDKQIAALTAEKQSATGQLEKLVIDGAIRDQALKAGVRPTAIDDVLLRGRNVFRLQDGKAVPMDGDKPIYGKSGDPMGVDEWVGSLTDRAPHLFEPSQGGGAKPGAGAVGAGGKRVVTRSQYEATAPEARRALLQDAVLQD